MRWQGCSASLPAAACPASSGAVHRGRGRGGPGGNGVLDQGACRPRAAHVGRPRPAGSSRRHRQRRADGRPRPQRSMRAAAASRGAGLTVGDAHAIKQHYFQVPARELVRSKRLKVGESTLPAGPARGSQQPAWRRCRHTVGTITKGSLIHLVASMAIHEDTWGAEHSNKLYCTFRGADKSCCPGGRASWVPDARGMRFNCRLHPYSRGEGERCGNQSHLAWLTYVVTCASKAAIVVWRVRGQSQAEHGCFVAVRAPWPSLPRCA